MYSEILNKTSALRELSPSSKSRRRPYNHIRVASNNMVKPKQSGVVAPLVDFTSHFITGIYLSSKCEHELSSGHKSVATTVDTSALKSSACT